MSPQTRLRLVLRQSARLERVSVRAQLLFLRALRRSLLAEVADAAAGSYGQLRAQALLMAVDREIAAVRRPAEDAAANATRAALRLGADLVDGVLPAGQVLLADLSPELVTAAVDVTTDQVRAVYGELGAKLKASIRRATVGVDSPEKAMAAVAKVIRDPQTFGSAAVRAETIVRTETGRALSLATQKRMDQATANGARVRKWWLPAGDARTRPEHAAAGQRYGRENAIPTDEAFVVGGERLMYPGDPAGSAANTINCRCVAVPTVAA